MSVPLALVPYGQPRSRADSQTSRSEPGSGARSSPYKRGVSKPMLLTDLRTTGMDSSGCSWTKPSSVTPQAGPSANYGLIWTAGTLLRI